MKRPLAFVAVALVGTGIGVALTSMLSQAQPGEDEPRSAPAARRAKLGANASLGGRRAFPDDNAWNVPIDHLPVDPNSDAYVASIGVDGRLHPEFGAPYRGAPNGIPYVVVPGDQPRVPVTFRYADESDQCLYPIPPDAPVEGGPNAPPNSDRHVLVIDRDNWRLYELYAARREDGNWSAGSGAVFDLNSDALRPSGWTSADAAGLPIFPGLVRYDEVMEQKEIRHALRFTAEKTRKAYIYPARHCASPHTDPNLPPMGLRVRLKASFDVSGYPAPARVILQALKKYGMILADNGANWFVSGAPDPRWNDEDLGTLKQVQGKDFEVVRIGNITTP